MVARCGSGVSGRGCSNVLVAAMTVAMMAAGCEQDAGSGGAMSGSGAVTGGPGPGAQACQPGQVVLCDCPDGTQPQASCLADGSGYGLCPCADGQQGSGGAMSGSGGQPGTGGDGSGGDGSGGDGSGGDGSGGDGSGGMSMGNPSDDLDALRQACVDHINMHRASVGLDPLMRATASQESCSDEGAASDSATYAATRVAHESAGKCAGLGAQNTCPGAVPYDSVDSAMKRCLDQMWAEGAPPVPVPDCIRDYQGCFLKYGHYINMTSTDARVVSCGFYEQPDGSWWMNQNFGN